MFFQDIPMFPVPDQDLVQNQVQLRRVHHIVNKHSQAGVHLNPRDVNNESRAVALVEQEADSAGTELQVEVYFAQLL